MAHQGAKSLFAVESGSRAWGFESATSDYDVRFVYWMPRDWYLSIEAKRDVIEELGDDDLDFAGWDVRKALGLAYKSNPSLHDWLATDLIYAKDEDRFPEFRELCLEYFQPTACIHHFRSLAQTNFQKYAEAPTLPFKKYFYVFRALLCAQYIEEEQAPAPCRFESLLDRYFPEGEIREAMDGLLLKKREGTETALSPALPILHHEIKRRMSQPLPSNSNSAPRSREKLDDYFRRLIL